MGQEPHVAWTLADAGSASHPLLDCAERARCARLAHEADRARHASGRVLAKLEGARRLHVDPGRLSVVPDIGATLGRPVLLLDGRPSGVHLSIAHAGGVVVVALGEAPCGVDVEEIAALSEALSLSAAFSPAERALLAGIPAAERMMLAGRWWTGKEAALKAVGIGLAVEAAAVDASTTRTRIRTRNGVTRLRLVRLDAPRGYCASLAYVVRTRRYISLPAWVHT